MYTLEIDSERRRLLVLRKTINSMETALQNAINVANEMEELLFEEWERQSMGKAQ